MVPSVALGASDLEPLRKPSIDASALALKLLERPIVRDYLEYTHGVPEELLADMPNEEDWWDTVDKASYAKVLAARHKKPTYDWWVAVYELKMPDLLTFNGPVVLGPSGLIKQPPIEAPKRGQGRSEVYEIKPNNDKGRKDAQIKLNNVEASYRDGGISGIYRRGKAYPFLFTRRIEIKTRFIEIFKYLMNLFLIPVRASVRSISIEINRPEDGVLLYKICVDLDGLDHASKEQARAVARFAVRILSELNTLNATPKVQEAAKALAMTLEPDEPALKGPQEVQWIYAGRDLRKTPDLRLKPGAIADEVAPLLTGLRDGMYSRLMGKPGERYFICADENWYRANIQLPGIVRALNVARMVGSNDLLRSVAGRNLLGVAPTMLITAKEMTLSIPFVGDVLHWLSEHIELVLIIVAVTVVVTALVLVTAGAAAAPLAAVALPVADVAAGGLATAEVGLMVAPVMAEVVGAEAAGVVGAPLATMGGEASANLLTVTRAILSAPATAGELSAASAQQVADNILIRAMTSPPVQATLLKTAAKLATPAALACIGLCPSRAFAYSGPANGPLQSGGLQEQQSVDLGVGKLFVLRVPQILPYPSPKAPALYDPFEADRFADPGPPDFNPDGPKGGAMPKIGKLWMMGSFDVV